jgi:hypothetical protein
VTYGYWTRVCWTASAAAGVSRSSQSVGPAGRTGTATANRYGTTTTTATAATPRRAAPQDRADGERDDGGDREYGRGAYDDPHLGQRAHRVHVRAVAAHDPLTEHHGDRGAGQAGRERDRADHQRPWRPAPGHDAATP